MILPTLVITPFAIVIHRLTGHFRSYTLCRVDAMLDAFSYNREYDYIRLEGLYRATRRPAHEWDIYIIIKELIDNTLDADEVLWCHDNRLFSLLSLRMEYISVPPPQSQQLIVRGILRRWHQ